MAYRLAEVPEAWLALKFKYHFVHCFSAIPIVDPMSKPHRHLINPHASVLRHPIADLYFGFVITHVSLFVVQRIFGANFPRFSPYTCPAMQKHSHELLVDLN